MNPPIRFGLALVFLLVLLPATARSLCLTHPTEPAATFLGSFTLSIPLSDGAGVPQSNCQIIVEVCAWLLPNTRVDYVLNVGTIDFTGNCDGADSLPLATMLDQLAGGAVKKGTELGITDCGDTIDIWVGQCAERYGSGGETSFEPCNTAWCKRRYAIICSPNGTIYRQLVEDPALCTGVATGCERGCGE